MILPAALFPDKLYPKRRDAFDRIRSVTQFQLTCAKRNLYRQKSVFSQLEVEQKVVKNSFGLGKEEVEEPVLYIINKKGKQKLFLHVVDDNLQYNNRSISLVISGLGSSLADIDLCAHPEINF
jgi:hypothetical protein